MSPTPKSLNIAKVCFAQQKAARSPGDSPWQPPLRLKAQGGGFPGGSVVKNPPADVGVTDLIPDPGKTPLHASARVSLECHN